MRPISRHILLFTSTLLSAATFAQESRPSWLVETMYKSGKINTVVAVVAVLIAGLAAWMFMMDRRIRKMEQRQRPN